MLVKTVKNTEIGSDLNLLARNVLALVSHSEIDHAEIESLTLELQLNFKDNNNE